MYTLVNELIICKGRIFFVPSSTVRRMVLKYFHASPMARHPGFYKTYQKIREHFTWKGLKVEVFPYVMECSTCQQNKQEHSYLAGLLQPLLILDRKWESLSMEFIIGLSRAQGRDYIYVVVDLLMNFAHFFSITATYTAT